MRKIIKEDPKRIKIDIQKAYAFRKRDRFSLIPETTAFHVEKAYDLFCRFAAPASVVTEVTRSQFQSIYFGAECNDPGTPLTKMMTANAVYYLFAMTLGHDVSLYISDLFKNGEHLLGYLLDEICSIGIEEFADDISRKYFTSKVSRGTLNDNDVVLRYSPGYCGWNITDQKMLHEYLQSRDIGITLTDKCYMEPIKSISGVMIGGSQSMHNFYNNYSFCESCRTKACRERLVMNGILP
ncbi:MAG TPA: vitamin B12 dependent-methionine synthase activation domain-containing protein [Smithella sp.]|nr:vitamin B12 dependent-methionine synthase activation domain-containing protein [Smithella sp.]